MLANCSKVDCLESEKGSTLIEILVGVVLLAVMVMAIGSMSLTTMQTRERTIRRALADQLALDKIEELSATNPETLNDADDSVENLTFSNVDYTRTTDVTQNADDSRTAVVTVVASGDVLGVNVSHSILLPLWGEG